MSTFTKTLFTVSGDGFFREETDAENALEWAEYYAEQGSLNIKVEKVTTIREVIFQQPVGPK